MAAGMANALQTTASLAALCNEADTPGTSNALRGT